MRNGLACCWWSLQDVSKTGDIPVRVTKMKFRNRHFTMPASMLEHGIVVDPPSQPSLFHTAEYFINLLSPDDYKKLGSTARALHGRTVRVGTTCSGCDIGVTAVKSILKKINRAFQVSRQLL